MPYLLHTKTLVPPISTQYVYRRRLVEQINANPSARLVLVSAPAGAGKTSCLVEWAHMAKTDDRWVAWLALDEQDNDPACFAAYLCRAFEVADPAFSTHFPDEMPDLQSAAAVILNVVVEQGERWVLVLDDYHLITNPQIHHAIGTMCEHLPANMRIVIGTRADPPLQLARLRARGEIAEVRMRDLRFSAQEITDLLHASVGWSLSGAVLDRLETATEGWAAALALILMSVNTEQPQLSEAALERHLAAFSQTQQHIFDYLADEVLHQQPADVQQFLLDTCVLDRLTPDVCRALTGQHDAPLRLTELAHKSLFVIPLSDFEPIYRYHHLFEDFLRQRLKLHDASHYHHQHGVAAEWYAAEGSTADAVRHALEAQAYDEAAVLIKDAAWEAMTARGEIMTILNWLHRFPVEALQRHPRLCLYFSRALYLTGDIDESATYVQMAADALDANPDTYAGQEALRAIAANYQATLAAYRGDITRGMALNEQAEALRHEVDALDQVRITNTCAYLRFLRGNVTGAREIYEASLGQARELDHHYLTLDASYYLARLDLMAGELRQAERRCEAALAEIPAQIAPASTVMLPLAQVRWEQGDAVEAERLLRDAITLAQRGNIPDVLWLAFVMLSEVLAARGEAGEATICLELARRTAGRFDSPPMLSYIEAAGARVALQSGDVDAAAGWAAGYDPAAGVEYQRDAENLTLAQVWFAQGDLDGMLPLLAEVMDEARAAGRYGAVTRAEALSALAYQAMNRPGDSLRSIAPVLAHAGREGYVRLLLSQGRPMLMLLQRAVEQGVEPRTAAAFLNIERQAEQLHPADALTERELEVLHEVAAGASNQEIADSLVISVGTVKTHIHRIMNKLDAQNRTEAAAKARSLNLLDD